MSSAPSMSPLASPAISMKCSGFTRSTRNRHLLRAHALDLSRDFESQIQCAHRRFAIDERLLLLAHAIDEMFQLEFQRLFLRDGHWLAHDFLSAEFAHD